MKVDPSQAITVAHDGETYHFCAPACREAFVNDPASYLSISQ
jgi:YHS domain-containing protein